MPLDHLPPGLLERRRMQIAFDRKCQPADINAGVVIINAMEEHALLRWRQWVNIFDIAIVADQQVDIGLTQPGQWKVRRCETPELNRKAVGHQVMQETRKRICESLYGLDSKNIAAESPINPKSSAGYHRIYFQQMTSMCIC